jgi:nicotinic acid mononucleotide adenylyltransferase
MRTVARTVERHRLLAVVKVAALHRRDVGARGLAPFAHRMRMLARVVLDRQRRTAVGVALAQYRVHRAAEDLGIAGADRLLFIGLRVLGKSGIM